MPKSQILSIEADTQKELSVVPKPRANMVIIRPERRIEDLYYKLKSGLIVPTQWNPDETAVVMGTVVSWGPLAYSRKVVTRHGGGGAPTEVDCDIDFRRGDTVYFRYNAAKNAYENKRVLGVEGDEIYLLIINRDELTCIVRDDKIISVNGNVIMERVPSVKPSNKWIDIPEGFNPEYYADRGKIVAISPAREFWWERHYGATHNEFREGDTVIFGVAHTLDNKIVTSQQWDLIRTGEPDIICKLTDDGYELNKSYIAVDVEPVKEMSKILHTIGLKDNKKLYRYRVVVVRQVSKWEELASVGKRYLIRATHMGTKLPDGRICVRSTEQTLWAEVDGDHIIN